MSPPRKSIQAINQDKPAARSNCPLFVILSRGGNNNYDYAHRHQPPPSLPRRGGTDTLDCQWLIRLGVTCISPTGENERGLMMISGETYSYSRHQPPLNHISPHLTSPVGWAVIIRDTNNEKRLNNDMEVVIQPLHLSQNGHYAVRRFNPIRALCRLGFNPHRPRG